MRPKTRSQILLCAVALAIPAGFALAGHVHAGGPAPLALMTFAVAAFSRPLP